jgi:hypothetical protein
MAIHTKHSARSLLDPVGADRLRQALERLRANGLTDAEAAAEMIRKNLYDFLDSETDAQSGAVPRLRIVKR